jgi:aryl-alcohol dehydrogenase-like predicted oxidoreductase
MKGDLVRLTDAQRWTTRAGFGCAGLMGILSRRESLALLEAAWEAGVRHFDVAPLYGHGETERVLGTFLRGRRDQVTLVTKYGMEPTGNSPLVNFARAVARPLVSRIPALRRAAKAGASASPVSSTPVSSTPLTAEGARLSLERSLRALQTDYVDALLLHEPRTETLYDDGLLAFLNTAVQKGMIRTFGVGGDRGHAAAIFRSRPEYCRLVQCRWSVHDGALPAFPGSQLIVFGVASQLGRDRQTPADAALRAAALALPESIILFSSRNRAHIAASAKAISDTALDSAARQLQNPYVNP